MDMTPHFPIYLDYASTNPVDPRVVDAMIPWLRERFGNPASRSHAWGWEAEEAVEKARADVGALIGADPREIVWTSGATESNNLAIKGAAHFYQSKGKHLITAKTEHKAVLDTMRELERQGFEVTYLDVQADGLIDMDVLKSAIRPDTILISVMFVNNEIGVIQDIPAIGALCRERGIIFHVDAAQATGKVEIDLATLPVDLMSLASHKTYGPKGIGALYIRRSLVAGLDTPTLTFYDKSHIAKFELGTPAFEALAGWLAALRYIAVEVGGAEDDGALPTRAALERGYHAIEALEAPVKEALVRGLAAIDGVRIYGSIDLSERVGTVAFRVRDLDPAAVAKALGDLGVCVGNGHFYAILPCAALGVLESGGVVRASIAHYSSAQDVQRLLEGVAAISAQGACN